MYVSYRFSRQPLTRLFWNFAWCFEIMSERQLSILVSIGCIITELWHNKGVWGGLEVTSHKKVKVTQQCNELAWLNIWRQILSLASMELLLASYTNFNGQTRRIDDGWQGKGAKRAVTGDGWIVMGARWRTAGDGRGVGGDGWWKTDVKHSSIIKCF